MEFCQCKKEQVSSFFEPNYEFLRLFPNSERFEVIRILQLDCDTLDNQLSKRGIRQVDFIKLDTQGSELLILQGAKIALKSCIGLEIEVEFCELYKGQPLFPEVHSFVSQRGFQLIDLAQYYWKRSSSIPTGAGKGQLIFGDALYFKTPELLSKEPQIDIHKVLHALLVYLAYGYTDISVSLLSQSYTKGIIDDKLYRVLTKIVEAKIDNDKLPNFRGRSRIAEVFKRLSNILATKSWKGASDRLGN